MFADERAEWWELLIPSEISGHPQAWNLVSGTLHALARDTG
jgi:hypothetical protein